MNLDNEPDFMTNPEPANTAAKAQELLRHVRNQRGEIHVPSH
jgi:hypothetical protein